MVVSSLVVCNVYAEALFCALLRPFALFCALLQTCVCALCAELGSFALFCAHLRVSASDRVWNDPIWELPTPASLPSGTARGGTSRKFKGGGTS